MNPEAIETIKKEVEGNAVLLFMKGTPDFPQCGFSARAVQALRASGVEFKAINVFDDEQIYRQGVKEYSNWPTIPQLYIGGELVGGSDIIIELMQSGELKQLADAAASKADS